MRGFFVPEDKSKSALLRKMLPVRFRLKEKKEFSRVFRKGKTLSNELLVMKHEEIGGEGLRIGFSAGTKYSKKASQRSRAKRLMREAVRELLPDIKPGRRIIFIVNSGFPLKQASYSLVREKTEDLLKKAKLLK